MSMGKYLIVAAFFSGCLLTSIICAASAHALGNPAVFSIEEKDLFSYRATSLNPVTPCATFTSANLPKASRFDSTTGLFTWLPEFGSAGSYTVTFGCADALTNPGTQQIQIDVAPVTPVYIQSSTPKVTLVAAKNPVSASQDNDQKSLTIMLGVYGLAVETVEDLAAAFAAKTVGEILVIPSYMAKNLTPATIQQVVSHVKGGGSILLFGRSPLSETLGISYSSGTMNVTEFVDYLNPQLPLTWTDGEPVETFVANGSDRIHAVDKQTLNPLIVGRPYDRGRMLYVGTDYYDHFSVYGTKGHPYLLYHFVDAFRLKSRVSASSIDAYFDPGNYDLSKVYIEDIVRSWADRGITTVYAAAWHFWINEQTGKEWTFGYQHFIEVCHQWGIKVYPWFAFPHVSQKFWFTKPECREKTAGAGETYAFWRLNVNIQNQVCLDSVFQFMDDMLSTYDWDGVNVAEIYYDYEKGSIEYFTPMNADVRADYQVLSGFDPKLFFDPASPKYYVNDSTEWKQFLDYRTDLVTGLHDKFLNRLFAHPKAHELDIVLTIVDSLNYNYYDIVLPDVAGLLDTGVDLPSVLKLREKYDFTVQIEDPWPFWSSNPFRYEDFKKIYLSNFSFFKNNNDLLYFDVNIVQYAHTRASDEPRYGFPSRMQTGLEFALLLKNMFSDSRRLALFSENSVESVDMERLKWALAGDTLVNQGNGGTVSFTTKRTTRLEGSPTFYNASLGGKEWPAWSSVDGTLLLPVGSGTLSFNTGSAYNGIRLAGISCALEDAGVVPGGITVSYDSPRQKAVLTVEAFAKKDSEPFRILVDGKLYDATIYPFYGNYRVFLPKGKHSVQINVMHQLSADNTQLGGAADISFNAPITMTFTDPMDPVTLTSSTFIVKDANNNVQSGTISYDAASMTATFTPATPLALGSTYTVTVTSGATDIYGRSMPSAKSLTFTTESFGDINNNKKVDLSAVLKYLRVALGLEPQPNLAAAQIIIAPINRATGKPQPQAGRTMVNIQDALAALERVVGLW